MLTEDAPVFIWDIKMLVEALRKITFTRMCTHPHDFIRTVGFLPFLEHYINAIGWNL